MGAWPKHPLIYEINAWVWLDELSKKAGEALTLATVPDDEWDRIAATGFNAVWLMGVWERSPMGIGISMSNEGLLADFRRALPDFTPADNVGSPYCVRNYVVDAHLGGAEALAIVRQKLSKKGIRLLLDLVPNHVAPDHPWALDHPEYFIRGSEEDLNRDPGSFMKVGGQVFACGKDPYFPAWPDVLQLNAFDGDLRRAMTRTVQAIAEQCDGVRCDMAMLLITGVFERTWGERAGGRPGTEYWREIIPAVKEKYPEFRFIAEAYWDLEWELQQQGFDFCYDKRLYDRLEHDHAETIRLHLCAEDTFQEKLVRFVENHDEPRAAAAFPGPKNRAAALTALSIPGARLVHEGQMEGRLTRLPVFLGRRPGEDPDTELMSFYGQLLRELQTGDYFDGTWRLCETGGWPDNASHLNLVAWCWKGQTDRCLIVVNLSGMHVQGLVRVPWDDLKGRAWPLKDVFTSALYERNGDEIYGPGFYIDLAPWAFHFFVWVERLS